LPEKSEPCISPKNPIGLQYEKIIKLLPEFDFYNGNTYLMPNLHREFVTNPKQGKAIWELRNVVEKMIFKAEKFEKESNFKEAATIYEKIIAEKIYLTKPYDRLIKIYSRAKLKNDEKRVLESSIMHFTKLRDKQKEYVLHLAQKYRKLNFANEYIANDKKIYYYNGAFELYNPYTIIQKWEQRLIKIEQLIKKQTI
jgi:hypothetical protein